MNGKDWGPGEDCIVSLDDSRTGGEVACDHLRPRANVASYGGKHGIIGHSCGTGGVKMRDIAKQGIGHKFAINRPWNVKCQAKVGNDMGCDVAPPPKRVKHGMVL